MKDLILNIRATLFYICYSGFTTVFSLTALIFIWFLPFEKKYNYIANWNRVVLFFCRKILGIEYRIQGAENIPEKGPYVVLSKHQSQWETFYLLVLFRPVSIILKRELLKIPGFGWGLRMMKPIPIDRSNPKESLRQIREEGLKRLKEDHLPVMIFPEGTRIPYGETGKYAKGGAALAIEANVPVLFVSHNAGAFWPHTQFQKYAGTVDIKVSELIDPEGMTAKELTDMAKEWIESNIEPAQL